ncbi:MAG: ATP-binding protein [Chloroflexi bacterium]|nr:ATP-binding protein [Chloroflexota bacterium]
MAQSQPPAPAPQDPSPLLPDVQRLLDGLPRPLPLPVVRPGLVIVSGLPGTGKSFLARRLAQRVPLAVLESDALRKALAASPTYSPEESLRVFVAIHGLIDALLAEGIPVLLDATTLHEAHREPLYQIAEGRRAWVALVMTIAPSQVVRRRLDVRTQQAHRADSSDADWEVYQRMRYAQEPISRPHYRVDTSRDVTPVLDRIVQDIREKMVQGG